MTLVVAEALRSPSSGHPLHRHTPVCTADFSPLLIHFKARSLLGNIEEGSGIPYFVIIK